MPPTINVTSPILSLKTARRPIIHQFSELECKSGSGLWQNDDMIGRQVICIKLKLAIYVRYLDDQP